MVQAGTWVASGANPLSASKGMPMIAGGRCLFLKASSVAVTQWSDVANNDEVLVSGVYPT